MNSSYVGSINTSPYEVVFGQKPNNTFGIGVLSSSSSEKNGQPDVDNQDTPDVSIHDENRKHQCEYY